MRCLGSCTRVSATVEGTTSKRYRRKFFRQPSLSACIFRTVLCRFSDILQRKLSVCSMSNTLLKANAKLYQKLYIIYQWLRASKQARILLKFSQLSRTLEISRFYRIRNEKVLESFAKQKQKFPCEIDSNERPGMVHKLRSLLHR